MAKTPKNPLAAEFKAKYAAAKAAVGTPTEPAKDKTNISENVAAPNNRRKRKSPADSSAPAKRGKGKAKVMMSSSEFIFYLTLVVTVFFSCFLCRLERATRRSLLLMSKSPSPLLLRCFHPPQNSRKHSKRSVANPRISPSTHSTPPSSRAYLFPRS